MFSVVKISYYNAMKVIIFPVFDHSALHKSPAEHHFSWNVSLQAASRHFTVKGHHRAFLPYTKSGAVFVLRATVIENRWLQCHYCSPAKCNSKHCQYKIGHVLTGMQWVTSDNRASRRTIHSSKYKYLKIALQCNT